MHILFFRIACLLGALAVILGAFGAHGLEGKISPEQIRSYETGVRYHFIHTLALLLTALFYNQLNPRWAGLAGAFFLAGVLLFSASIYLLSTRSLLGIENWTWLGPITPLGGVAFILGWIFLLVSSVSRPLADM
mgnify:CR=1 FL=1